MVAPPERPESRVLALISQLLRRPIRVDRRLPLIWLSGWDNGSGVLRVLLERLRLPARYRVLHARVDMVGEEAPSDIRQLLRMLCTQLAAPLFGGNGCRLGTTS